MLGPYYVLNDTQRHAAWGKPGTAGQGGDVQLVDISFCGLKRSVNKLAKEAFTEWERIRLAHGYEVSGQDTGFYSYRHMRHDPSLPWSPHAWAMAGDIDWLENPAGSKLVTNMPQPMRDDILALTTNSGARVFRWGGDWDNDGLSNDHTYVDAMHWEVIAHPLDLATGIKGADEMVTRDSKADDGSPTLKPAFDKAVSKGVMSAATQPGGIAFNDEFATFLDRAGVLDLKAWQKDILERLTALEHAGPQDGLNEAQVKAIINDSQIVAG